MTLEDIMNELAAQDTTETILNRIAFQATLHYGEEFTDAALKLHAAGTERIAATDDPTVKLAIAKKAEAALKKKHNAICERAGARARAEVAAKQTGKWVEPTMPPAEDDLIFVD